MNNEITDNELLYLIEENSDEAIAKIIERYTPKIRKIIGKYKTKGLALGLDISDLFQEGLIGLISAIKSFDKEKETSFKTYADIIIEREILDILKRNDRIKYKTLNSAISLDNFKEDETNNLYNFLENNNTPEKELINKEYEKELIKNLAKFELKVYELKIEGKTNDEIALILNKPKKSIENTLVRIKSKIKEPTKR